MFISIYADDVIVIYNKQNYVDLLFKTLRDFEIISSARINWNRSEAFLVGKWEREVTVRKGVRSQMQG